MTKCTFSLGSLRSGCGTDLKLGTLKMVDGTHGDWQTESADYQKQGDDRNYIMVGHEGLRVLGILFVSGQI